MTVAASGFVMEAEKRKVIFESFLHKTSGRSMGAALARAYAVVREWGGELGFESEAPRGFRLHDVLASGGTGGTQPKATDWLRRGLRMRSAKPYWWWMTKPGFARLIVKILRRERYRVLEAGTATEAAAIAATHGGAIQLLLTDVMLPDRNGRQLAEKLVRGTAEAEGDVHLRLHRR